MIEFFDAYFSCCYYSYYYLYFYLLLLLLHRKKILIINPFCLGNTEEKKIQNANASNDDVRPFMHNFLGSLNAKAGLRTAHEIM